MPELIMSCYGYLRLYFQKDIIKKELNTVLLYLCRNKFYNF